MRAKIQIQSDAGSIDVTFDTDKEFSQADFKGLLSYVRENFGPSESKDNRATADHQAAEANARANLANVTFDQMMAKTKASNLQEAILIAAAFKHFHGSTQGFTESDLIQVMQASTSASKFYNGGSIAADIASMVPGSLTPVPNSSGAYTLASEQLWISLFWPEPE